jgi:putative ABC transport system permease protein
LIFLALVGKNLLRRPTRSLLTIAGIAIGIGAVVALASLAWGFEKSWERAYAVRGTDLVVTKVTSQSPLAAPFDGGIKDQLLRLPHIEKATGLLSDMVSVEDSPTVLVFGWELQGFLWEHLQLIEGRWPANDSDKCVVIGTLASTVLKKSLVLPSRSKPANSPFVASSRAEPWWKTAPSSWPYRNCRTSWAILGESIS